MVRNIEFVSVSATDIALDCLMPHWTQTQQYPNIFNFRHVRKLPYVDETKIGIWGWGYGGYLTIRALSQDSKLVSMMSRDSSQGNKTRDDEVQIEIIFDSLLIRLFVL